MIGYVTIGTKDLARAGNFYVAYFRDPEGNKLNAFCMQG